MSTVPSSCAAWQIFIGKRNIHSKSPRANRRARLPVFFPFAVPFHPRRTFSSLPPTLLTPILLVNSPSCFDLLLLTSADPPDFTPYQEHSSALPILPSSSRCHRFHLQTVSSLCLQLFCNPIHHFYSQVPFLRLSCYLHPFPSRLLSTVLVPVNNLIARTHLSPDARTSLRGVPPPFAWDDGHTRPFAPGETNYGRRRASSPVGHYDLFLCATNAHPSSSSSTSCTSSHLW